jgi:hypothetical protein
MARATPTGQTAAIAVTRGWLENSPAAHLRRILFLPAGHRAATIRSTETISVCLPGSRAIAPPSCTDDVLFWRNDLS